jgi:hypothetical protein
MRTTIVLVLSTLALTACVQAGSPARTSAVLQQRGGFPGGPPPGGPGFPGRPGFPGPGGRGGPGVREEQKLVKMFDKDGDGRLNATERAAAREWLHQNGGGGGFGRRGGPRGFGRGGFGGTPDPSPHLAPADVKTYPAGSLYDLNVLRTVFFQFEESDWEQELADFYNTDVEVPATVTVDGKVYKDVGVRFRGNSSYMMVPAGYKKSLNVSLDFVNKDQKIDGYHTLHLLNANQDPTFARIVLYSLIGREFIPMPKANAMRIAINGENRGIYINTQPFNKDFLKEWFGANDTSGARWKVPGSPGARFGGLSYLGDDPAPYRNAYELKTKDTPKAWTNLAKLTRVLNETPLGDLETALAPLLDVDEALKFLAVDMAFVNGDGYWTRGSDYSLYEDAKGQFHVIPHDFNEGFGAEEGGRGGFGGFGSGGTGLDPLVGLNDPSKPLRSKLLAVPALRARYLTYVHDVAERLDWAKVGPTIAKFETLIAPTVEIDTRKLSSFEAFQTGIGGPGASDQTLRGFVEARRKYLLAYKQ